MPPFISKEELKQEGESLLHQFRNTLNEFEDIFRLNYSDSDFKSIKKMKEDLNIAESVAIHEQLKREGKPIGDTYHWYNKYKKYIIVKTEDKKQRLIDTAPSGFFNPDLESIYRIFELVDIDVELFEDLYFDVKRFLMKYQLGVVNWE